MTAPATTPAVATPTPPGAAAKPLLPPHTAVVTPSELEQAYALGLLRKDALVHGSYYRGTCRNARLARWHGRAERFVHWREKFGQRFLEAIAHPVDEQRYDVFLAVEATLPAPGQDIDDDAFERFFD